MKTKLALFDLDGTLFNTNDVNFMAYQKALEEQGFALEYDFFCEYCNGRKYTVFLPEIIKSGVEDTSRVQEIMEIVHKRKKVLYKTFLNKAKINQHLFFMAEAMKRDYYLAVVTTASRKNAMDILEYFQKVSLFDLILTQDEVINPKPDPEGFQKAMEYFKIDGENTVIFEDSKVGIEAAKACKASVMVINQF